MLPDDLKDEFRGLYHNGNDIKLILISQVDDLEEKTFTLAHELGHYVLHRKLLVSTQWVNSYWKDERH